MLENYWYIACKSSRLKRVPIAIRLFDKPIVLFRNNEGQAHALEDRCRHRNASLSCGKVVDGTVQCPYHGWRYDGAGRLVEIPYSTQLPNETIPAYTCYEQEGYVWVCVGTPDESSKPYSFPHLSTEGWTSFRLDTLFKGSVESCLENFLDCPHATQVHKAWFRSPTTKLVKAVVRSLDDGAVAEYFNEPREKSVVWSLLSPTGEEMKHTDRFIAPATSQVDYQFSKGRQYTISSCCTPIDDKTTRVHTVISFKYGKLGALVRLFFQPLSLFIIRQDVQIMRQQHDNIERFGQPKFKVTPEDLLFSPIYKWRQALKEGKAPPEAGEKTDVELRL